MWPEVLQLDDRLIENWRRAKTAIAKSFERVTANALDNFGKSMGKARTKVRETERLQKHFVKGELESDEHRNVVPESPTHSMESIEHQV